MKTNNSYYKAACVRPPKANALITINGLGVNTRDAYRKPAKHRNGSIKQAVRLYSGEWRAVDAGAFGEMPTLESGRHLEAAGIIESEQKKWTRYLTEYGISKGEWLRRRAAHLHKVRSVAAANMLKDA